MTPSEANVLGLILTGFLRSQMELAPLFVITSKQWGTAKGLIASVVTQIVQGRSPLITGIPNSADMAEKNIDRTLIDHPDARIIQFDEPSEVGGSGGVLLHPPVGDDRDELGATRSAPVFGRKSVHIDSRRTLVFTGNNIRPDRDMVRRVSVITLDIPADGTLPHERVFRNPERGDKVRLMNWVRENRSAFIEAAVVLIKAWASEGHPPAGLRVRLPRVDADGWRHHAERWHRELDGATATTCTPTPQRHSAPRSCSSSPASSASARSRAATSRSS